VLESAGASGVLVAATALALGVVWVGLIVWAVRQEREARRLEVERSRDLDALVA
jgi:hypothetical protein